MARQLAIGRLRARPLPLALLFAVVAVAALTSPVAVLMLSPALALLALLLSGRAPGEQLILRLRERGRRRRRGPVALPVRRYHALFVRWTERTAASAHAVRPPPARALGIA